jgi:hypothetical protein
MAFKVCCSCNNEFDWVSCKAFDAAGAFLWEDKLLDLFESPDGTLRAFKLRDVSETVPWTTAGLLTLTAGTGTNTTSIPSKSGTAPTGRYKQWAVDIVEIDVATGTQITLVSDADLLSVQKSGTSGYGYHGLPSYTPRQVFSQLPACNDAGICVFRTMPSGHTGVLSLLMFDSWKQSTTSRYRIPPARVGQTTGQSFLRFTESATDADVAWNASAATIETALETLPSVVSATVTGGPLTQAAVDIEIEWANATDQFDSITTIKMYQLTSYESSLYDLTTGQITGRIESTTYDTGQQFCWSSSGDLIATKIVSSIRNLRKFTLGSDGFGGLITGGTFVWSTAIAPSTFGLSRVGYGVVVAVCNRTIVSGSGRTHAFIDESTGALNGYGDSTFESHESNSMRSSSVCAFTGDPITAGTAKSTSGQGYGELPSTGGALSTSWLLGGAPFGYITDDAILTITTGTDNAVDEQSLGATFAGVFSSTYVSTSITTVTGGDAFFPTKTYRRHTITPFGQTSYWNPDFEWRLRVGPTANPSAYATSWFAYGDSSAALDAELQSLLGNNSDGLPVLQITIFGADNAITPVPAYAHGLTIIATASNISADITAHNLMPDDYRLTIEFRSATLRIQRALAAVQTSDSTVQWQRDIGVHAARFSSTAKNNKVLITNGAVIAHCYGQALKKPATHPTLVTGPLP